MFESSRRWWIVPARCRTTENQSRLLTTDRISISEPEKNERGLTVIDRISACEIEEPSTGEVTLRAAAEAANAIAWKKSILDVDASKCVENCVTTERNERLCKRVLQGKRREGSFSIVVTRVRATGRRKRRQK